MLFRSIRLAFHKSERFDELTDHLQGPDPSNPYFEFAFYAPDILQFNTLPPAPSGRLAPEEKEFLCHTDGIAICQIVAFDVRSKACKGNATDNGLVWLAGAMSPSVIMVETASVFMSVYHQDQ